jgi:hypothetical protein
MFFRRFPLSAHLVKESAYRISYELRRKSYNIQNKSVQYVTHKFLNRFIYIPKI